MTQPRLLYPAAALLLVGSASGLTVSTLGVPPQVLRPTCCSARASPVMNSPGGFEGFGLDTLKRSFERLIDLRVARASHILCRSFDAQTLAEMEVWKADIANDPNKFAARAKESSVCPSREKGGDLGFFTRGKSARPPT